MFTPRTYTFFHRDPWHRVGRDTAASSYQEHFLIVEDLQMSFLFFVPLTPTPAFTAPLRVRGLCVYAYTFFTFSLPAPPFPPRVSG